MNKRRSSASGGNKDPKKTKSSTNVVEHLDGAKEVDGKQFPLLMTPTNILSFMNDGEDEEVNTIDDLQKIITLHRDVFLRLTREHGAILFRGFTPSMANPQPVTAQHFADVVKSFHLKNMPYVGGAAVRTNIIDDIVFTANESPPSEPIPFHHEMAQTPAPPTHIFFYCEIASETGGETPIILSNQVYKYFSENFPEFCKQVETKGVKYIRILPEEDDPTSAIGRGWKSTYLCTTKAEAEKKMTEQGTEFEWLANGNLKTTTAVLPAIKHDIRSTILEKRPQFFNSMVAAYLGWIDSRNDPKKAIILGDGTTINYEALEKTAAFMQENRVCFKWTHGDILAIDNTVTMHSRNTYTGKRRVLASIARGTIVLPHQPGIIPTLTLNRTGDVMPVIGFGCWKLPKEKCKEMIIAAIKAGYRHFDCAADYGNEKEVGAAFRQAFDAGIVKREELFITSKLWATYHRKEHVLPALQRSLDDLQLQYLDLYLIHHPIALKFVPFEQRYPPEWIHDPSATEKKMIYDPVPLSETWKALEDIITKKKTLVRNIGLSNFNIQIMRDLLTYAKIKPAVNQVEMHPYNTQEKLLRFCHENDIGVVAYSPLGAASYEELSMATKDDFVMNEKVVKEVQCRYGGKSAAQMILRWGVQRNTAVIPKTSSTLRLSENFDIFDFIFTPEEIKKISSLNCNRRFNDPGVFCEKVFGTFFPIYE